MKDWIVVPERLVMVAWTDSATMPGWKYEPFEPDLGLCISVGWLLADKDDAILLGASAMDGGAFGERTSIARVNVQWIRPLVAIDEQLRS